jgi:hypothetical protein
MDVLQSDMDSVADTGLIYQNKDDRRKTEEERKLNLELVKSCIKKISILDKT